MDQLDILPEGYSTEPIWDGLGLVPFCIAPHYRSDNPESELIDKTVEYYIENRLPFIALHDGEVHIQEVSELPNNLSQTSVKLPADV